MKIVEVDQQQPYVKMVVYGASGVGKTRFGSTAPNCLYLSCEAGLLSVRGMHQKAVIINSFEQLMDAFMELKMGKHKFDTVVLDSLTEVQRMHMDYVVAKKGLQKPGIGEWGENIDTMRRMCRGFRDLPMNVILIALEAQDKNEETGQLRIMPALQGKSLPDEVMGFFDIVGYMVADERLNKETGQKETYRAIRVQPTATIRAKDRLGKLGIWMEPDFKLVIEKIHGEKQEDGKLPEKKGA